MSTHYYIAETNRFCDFVGTLFDHLEECKQQNQELTAFTNELNAYKKKFTTLSLEFNRMKNQAANIEFSFEKEGFEQWKDTFAIEKGRKVISIDKRITLDSTGWSVESDNRLFGNTLELKLALAQINLRLEQKTNVEFARLTLIATEIHKLQNKLFQTLEKLPKEISQPMLMEDPFREVELVSAVVEEDAPYYSVSKAVKALGSALFYWLVPIHKYDPAELSHFGAHY